MEVKQLKEILLECGEVKRMGGVLILVKKSG